MARLWSSGFELNSATAGVEFGLTNGFTVQTSVVRSGTYAGEVNLASTNEWALYQFSSSNANGPYFFRAYFRIATAPSALARIIDLLTTAGGDRIRVDLNTDRTLQLHDEDGDIGSPSSALSLDTWHRIEVEVDLTGGAGAGIIKARLDGTEFAAATNRSLSSGIGQIQLGCANTITSGHWYIDDIAINDSTGSFQNSYPGEGEIIHLRPNAAGDNEEWNNGNGETFAEIDEVTPDDGTTNIGEITTNLTSDFNIDATPAALESGDAINCVQIGSRFIGGGESASQFVLRVKASANGTVEESSALNPTNTGSYTTNQVDNPKNYHLTLYDMPGASTEEWEKTDLDVAQIGVRTTTTGSNPVLVSTLWLLVDHKPGEGGGGESEGRTTATARGQAIRTQATGRTQAVSRGSV